MKRVKEIKGRLDYLENEVRKSYDWDTMKPARFHKDFVKEIKVLKWVLEIYDHLN